MNELKIVKSKGQIIGVFLNNQKLNGISSLKINNDYNSNSQKESVVIEFSEISRIEIIDN